MKNFCFLICCFFFSCVFSENWKMNQDSFITTPHSLNLEKGKLEYMATVGSLNLCDENGDATAEVFFTAYTKTGEIPSKRPITFCFNGGPGCCSMYLHIGFLGPKKIETDSEGKAVCVPHRLIDNMSTLLDISDLVFVDTVGTGFSRLDDEKAYVSGFYSLNGDIKECADFIEGYLSCFNRWLSPKYLIGESYGTARVSGLSEALHREYGIHLNGIVLISLAVDFQNFLISESQKYAYYVTLPFISHFPSYTTLAYYHKKISLDKSFDETLLESREFVENEYARALLKGERLTKKEFEEIAQKMAKYSGLSVDLIKKYNLRITPSVFVNSLLENERMGRYDGRIVGFAHPFFDEQCCDLFSDPSVYNVDRGLTECINSYLREDLGYKNNYAPYVTINEKANQVWDFSQFIENYSSFSSSLEFSLTANPHFKIFAASGYFDLVTPFCSSLYTTDHLNIPSSFRKRITVKNYMGGHMMYLNPKVLKEFKGDLKKFYQE